MLSAPRWDWRRGIMLRPRPLAFWTERLFFAGSKEAA